MEMEREIVGRWQKGLLYIWPDLPLYIIIYKDIRANASSSRFISKHLLGICNQKSFIVRLHQ